MFLPNYFVTLIFNDNTKELLGIFTPVIFQT